VDTSTPSTPAAPPQLSPDGHWWWDGQQWLPNTPTTATAARTIVPAQATPYAPQGWPATRPVSYQGQADADGLAMASVIVGVALFGLGSIPAVICAHKSRGRARSRGLEPSSLSLAGLIIGYVGGALMSVAVLVAIAIPTFLSQRASGELASVRSSLRAAAALEEGAAVEGAFVPLEELQARGLQVDPQVQLAVLSYSETTYCLGAQRGSTTRYYSPEAGISTVPC
jgi:hypothetical protein